jgi:hypothetical protein
MSEGIPVTMNHHDLTAEDGALRTAFEADSTGSHGCT